jgi:hypothetical protein
MTPLLITRDVKPAMKNFLSQKLAGSPSKEMISRRRFLSAIVTLQIKLLYLAGHCRIGQACGVIGVPQKYFRVLNILKLNYIMFIIVYNNLQFK